MIHKATCASLVAQMVKNMSAMRVTWIQSLGWEDPLEKRMATRSSILAWRVQRTEEPGWLQSMESQRVGSIYRYYDMTQFFFKTHSTSL